MVVDRLPFLSGDEKGAKARRGRIRSFLSSVPVLTLKDRIQRMGRSFSKKLSIYEVQLFDGVKALIGVRNDIVHGRVVNDVDLLYKESLRGQLLFKKNILCLSGCSELNVAKRTADFVNRSS